ncbi:MAG: ferritin-like domain-containing protein [Kaistella sp.]
MAKKTTTGKSATSTGKKTTPTGKTTSTGKKSTATSTKKSAETGKLKAKSDAAENLREFLVDGLKDLYWAEKALVKNLPKMAKNATSPKLQAAVNKHLEETKNQVTRLEDAFKAMGEKAKGEKCDAMDGLLKEAESIMKETEAGPVRDAAIIAAAQKVEHYEIASYGTLATYAKLLGENQTLSLLKATLAEEKTCDTDLTKLATTEINIKAKRA